jgi:TonB-linked SusC/RagA family outer membrane protein
MKKRIRRHPLTYQIMRVSFIQLVLIAALAGMAYAGDVVAQNLLNRKISLQVDEQEVKTVLRQLEKQADVRFMYSPQVVPANRKVSLNVTNQSLADVLTSLLKPLNVSYEVKGKQILLDKAPETGQLELRTKTVTLEALARTITGTVTDFENKQPIPGVTVVVKGTTKGTATDGSGVYSLRVDDADQTLVFSFVGYEPQEVAIANRTTIAVSLKPDIKALSEVVVVGYGTQRKTSTTAAVSTVKGDELKAAPVANINNSISGRVSGVLSFQGSGEPGKDASTLRVRGLGTTGSQNGALTIVDGIPRPFAQLNPNEIESITVLKDAAAVAPYGLAGANGVILVTTKRGKSGRISLSYNGWVGMQRPTRYPDYLNSYEFASLLNTANKNAGLPATYTDEQLQKYRDGSDPDHYPDHDWVREVINFQAPMTNHDLTLAGGSDKVRFFTSLRYMYQEGAVKTINFSRVNLASNIDVNATPTTTISLDVKGTLENTNNPGSSSGTGIFTSVTKNPPLLVNQLSFSNGKPGNELLPSIYESGYNKMTNNILFTQLTIEQKLPFIPGLAIKGVAAYDKNYSLSKIWQIPFTYYTLNAQDQFVTTKGGVGAPQLSQAFSQSPKTTLQGYITYLNTFGKHAVNVLGVVEQRNGQTDDFAASRLNYSVYLDQLSTGSTNKTNYDNSGSASSSKQVGFVGRASYNYAEKYLVELAGRYDGHYYFAPGQRFAFFPAASLGWRISEEPFFKDRVLWVNNLKIRASYGKSGNLAGSPFQYLSTYGLANSYVFGGTQFYQTQGVFERNEANPNITWETAKKFDIGLEASLWNGRLNLEADYFHERRSNMLVSPAQTVPVEYGIGISQVNAGEMSNRGVDLSINTRQSFRGGLKLDATFNFTYAANKLIQTFENASTFNNPNRRRTGRPYNARFGYRATGFFQSEEEIKASATQFGALKPGDIKYEDINSDGKIDGNDEVFIGKPLEPQMILGLTTNLTWKGFNLNLLWQGAASSTLLLENEAQLPFFNGAKVFREQLDYWTPENPNAAYPRVTPSPTTNNSQVSSFWIRDGSYLRLKTLDFGYSFSPAVLSKLNAQTLRVYVSGQNLLTFSKVPFLDPELASNRARYYFQQKVYTVGLTIGF